MITEDAGDPLRQRLIVKLSALKTIGSTTTGKYPALCDQWELTPAQAMPVREA